MASKIAFLCLLAGLLVASPTIADDDSGIYYQIGFMWPGAYCAQTKAGCCMPATGVAPAADFYISSFTVYNATTNEPEIKCSTDPFNLNEIIDIEGLKKYWSNIKCPSNNGQSSWKNAWKTAGVCSGLDEKGYFQAALSLRQRFNPLARLTSNGIKPDFGLYNLKGIKTVIKKAVGVTPVVRCSKGPFNKFQLYQIFVCASAGDKKKFIDCPAPPKYTCSDEILFHPFKKWMLQKTTTAANVGAASSYVDHVVDPLIEMPGVAMDD